jgi:glycosyltransferase involved in cell wall biosynthesis
MSRVKIFADCHVFDGTPQGSTTYLKGLYSELIADKQKTFFLAANNPKNLEQIFGQHDNVVYLQYRWKNKFMRLLFDTPALIKKHQIDVAHFQYVVPPIKKCRYVVTLHDVLFLDFPKYFPLPYRIKNRLLFEISAKYSDVVLTVSDYSKQRINAHFNVKDVAITPNAVDPIFFEPYDKAAVRAEVKAKYGAENYWLFVSRWEPRKNHLMLLKAFAEHEFHQNYQLVFIGDAALANPAFDDYFSKLDKEVKAQVIFLSRVGFEDMVQLVRGATLSAYPSIAEGFGIPPLESLAANVPTICSNTTAMSDFDFIEKNLFNPYDADDIAQKAAYALTQSVSAATREKVASRYQWRHAAAFFCEAIGRLGF